MELPNNSEIINKLSEINLNDFELPNNSEITNKLPEINLNDFEFPEYRRFPENRYYSITPDGRVYSHHYGYYLKLSLNKIGFRFVTLHDDCGVKFHYVHDLVAITYIPNPNNWKFVRHINGNREDNRVENLEWSPYPTQCKEVAQIDKSGEVINVFPSITEAARRTNIDRTSISRCCNRRGSAIAGGYIWNFA